MALFNRVEMMAASAAEGSAERPTGSDAGSRSVLETAVGDNLPREKSNPPSIDASARELEPPDGD
jgi:hypothetical protein